MSKATILPYLSLLVAIAMSGCVTLRDSSLVETPFANTSRTEPPEEPIYSANALPPQHDPQGPSRRAASTAGTSSFAAGSGKNDSSRGHPRPPIRLVNADEYEPLAEPWEASPAFRVDGLSDITRLPPVGTEEITFQDMFAEQWAGICSDHAEFYSPHGLAWLAGGVTAGALMANTGFDEHFVRDAYVDSIVLAPSDELYENLHQPKFLGDGYYTIPAFAVAALAEPLIGNLPLGSETAEWGQRSLRTILVGGPPMLGLQFLTGGGRPDETYESSEWQPFRDNNGVSGHSFMGAIPFMSAAKMTDNLWLKGSLYAASTLPALSRINDDAHYFSQTFLGWWLAYLAETAVDHSHDPKGNHHLFVYPQRGGMGVGLEYIR